MNTDQQNIENLRREEIAETTFHPHITTKQPPRHPKAADHGAVKPVARSLPQMQERVVFLVGQMAGRRRKNAEERVEAGHLLLKIRAIYEKHDDNTFKDGANRHVSSGEFWSWVKSTGLNKSTAHNWMQTALNGVDRNDCIPSRIRIKYWQEFNKEMRAATTEEEKVKLMLVAVNHIRAEYKISTKVKLALAAGVI